MDNLQKQKEHFESISEKYYESRQSTNHIVLKDLIWGLFFVNKHFLGLEKVEVLEPMCGYAEGENILARNLKHGTVLNYEGFDSSEYLVHTVKSANPGLNIYVADVTKFEPSKEYDLVIIIGGLHHVPDYAQLVVEKVAKSLKPGGYFINFEPTNNNHIVKRVRQEVYKRNKLFDEQTEKAFDLEELNTLFITSGFRIIDQMYPGLISYVLYYNPDAFPNLNIGTGRIVRLIFGIEKKLFRTVFGKKLSFCTLTLLKKIGL